MSTHDSRLADSSLPMSIGGTEYNCSMLTDKDRGDLQEWVRSRYIQLAMKSSKGLEQGDRDELVRIAISGAMNISLASKEAIDILFSTNDNAIGILRLGYQHILKRHPRVSFEVFCRNARKNLEDSCEAIMAMFTYFNTEETEETEEGDEGGSPSEKKKSENHEG